MVKLIGCPMHQGVSDKGLKKGINSLNKAYKLNIEKLDEEICEEEMLENLKNLNGIVKTCQKIAKRTDEIIKSGDFPLFIGGDHAAAMGTVAGASANAEHLGLLWIDSHSDINTDVTTISGNIHGMPVSAIMGFGNELLSSIYSEQPKVLPQHVVLFGVRDIDPLEREIIERLNIKTFSYDEVMKLGVERALKQAKKYLKGIDKLHVSFDLDSMNPDIIKGVTVPVKSGFVEEDILSIFDFILKGFKLSSIDIVEFNPVYDKDGHTAEFTNELINKIISSDIFVSEVI